MASTSRHSSVVEVEVREQPTTPTHRSGHGGWRRESSRPLSQARSLGVEVREQPTPLTGSVTGSGCERAADPSHRLGYGEWRRESSRPLLQGRSRGVEAREQPTLPAGPVTGSGGERAADPSCRAGHRTRDFRVLPSRSQKSFSEEDGAALRGPCQ